jgi:hypothetical protein
MNWKEFLKPNRKKILMFIILLIIFVFSFYGSGVLFYLGVFLYPIIISIGSLNCYNCGLIGIVLNIFYLYFLSCFIVWIFDRFKSGFEIKSVGKTT